MKKQLRASLINNDRRRLRKRHLKNEFALLQTLLSRLFPLLQFARLNRQVEFLLKLPSIPADPINFPSLRDEHYRLTSGYIDMRKTVSVFNAKPND